MAKNPDSMELSEIDKSATVMRANPCYGDWKPNEENEETTSTNQPTSAAVIYAVPEEPSKATVETKREATKSWTPDPPLVPRSDSGGIGKEGSVSPRMIPKDARATARCCVLTLLVAVAVGALVIALLQSSKPSSPGKVCV